MLETRTDRWQHSTAAEAFMASSNLVELRARWKETRAQGRVGLYLGHYDPEVLPKKYSLVLFGDTSFLETVIIDAKGSHGADSLRLVIEDWWSWQQAKYMEFDSRVGELFPVQEPRKEFTEWTEEWEKAAGIDPPSEEENEARFKLASDIWSLMGKGETFSLGPNLVEDYGLAIGWASRIFAVDNRKDDEIYLIYASDD